MYFLGDIALPPGMEEPNTGILTAKVSGTGIANLEGGISSAGESCLTHKKVFNSPSVVEFLKACNVKVVTLANNHIFDVDPLPNSTIEHLQKKGVAACGAGATLRQAEQPVILRERDKEFVFLAFGWEPIGCIAASLNRPGINPLRPKHVTSMVRLARESHPDAIIVLLVHWDFELELYPQPMHRQLAFLAIDAGANAIIGCHSHCVQGIEIYQKAPIVYGLGNWFLPHGKFFDGKLVFPWFADKQLVFEWNPGTPENFDCHWFAYEPANHQINFIRTEPLVNSAEIERLTPFKGFSHTEYVKWFTRNRRKKKGLPIYKDCRSTFANLGRDMWVKERQLLINILFNLGLKTGPS